MLRSKVGWRKREGSGYVALTSSTPDRRRHFRIRKCSRHYLLGARPLVDLFSIIGDAHSSSIFSIGIGIPMVVDSFVYRAIALGLWEPRCFLDLESRVDATRSILSSRLALHDFDLAKSTKLAMYFYRIRTYRKIQVHKHGQWERECRLQREEKERKSPRKYLYFSVHQISTENAPKTSRICNLSFKLKLMTTSQIHSHLSRFQIELTTALKILRLRRPLNSIPHPFSSLTCPCSNRSFVHLTRI